MKTHYLHSREDKILHPLPKHIGRPDYCICMKGPMKGRVIKVTRYGTFSAYDGNGKTHSFYDLKHISGLEYFIRKLFQW